MRLIFQGKSWQATHKTARTNVIQRFDSRFDGNKCLNSYFGKITNCVEIGCKQFLELTALAAFGLLCVHKQMLWRVHWCFMLICDICVFTECYANMSKGSETFDCDRTSSMRIQLFLSHFFFLVVAVLSINCDAAQRHGGMYSGVICDLGWSLVNMVLLRWSCQSDSQSVSFRKRGWERVKTHTERGDPTERIPSSQSLAAEPLK